jgi:hypothetical protein
MDSRNTLLRWKRASRAGQQHASGEAAAAGPSQVREPSAIISGGTRGLSRARNQLELVTRSPSYDKHGNQFKKSVDQKIQFSVIMMDDSAVQLFPSDRNTLKF